MTRDARRYLALATSAALVVLLAVGGVNAVIDPYHMTRLIELPGFNVRKPAMQNRVRLAKAIEVGSFQPAAIVLGTSRSHLALRMSHPAWQGASGYNLGFDGATPEEMYAYLRHANATGHLDRVVLGLDTWQLGRAPSFVRPDFDPMLLLDDNSIWSNAKVALARLRLLFSLDTLQASWRTVREQDAAADWFAADGQRLGEVFFRRPGEEFADLGQGAYFETIDRQEIGFKLPSAAARPLRPAPNDKKRPSSFEYIRRIVAYCREQHIDLRIFITPAHAHQMEIAAAVGEWPTIETGKRALVQLLADDAAAHPNATPFPLWDFSGYSSITSETVPPPGSRAEMAFYWDSSHFKEIVGDFVLDRLFGTSRPGHPVPADFGRRLTPATIDAMLLEIRGEQARYRWAHAADTEMIYSMVAAARGEPMTWLTYMAEVR